MDDVQRISQQIAQALRKAERDRVSQKRNKISLPLKASDKSTSTVSGDKPVCLSRATTSSDVSLSLSDVSTESSMPELPQDSHKLISAPASITRGIAITSNHRLECSASIAQTSV